MSKDVSELQNDNGILTQINQDFGNENDELTGKVEELNEKLERYRNYQLPSSATARTGRKRNDDQDDDQPSVKRRKISKNSGKGKKPIRNSDNDEESEKSLNVDCEEPNEEKARVRTFFSYLFLSFNIEIELIYSINF